MDQNSAIPGLTAGIVSAYVSHNALPVSLLGELIASVGASLSGLGNDTGIAPPVAELQPAVPIKKSVTPDAIISLLDGKPYKSLRRHLTSRGYTPESYREAFRLPADYPMVAPAYAKQRSELAKKMGLGRRDEPAAAQGQLRRKAA